MKATTVRQLRKHAKAQGKTLDQLRQEAELVAFMGNWSDPDNEVLVPTGYPIGQRVPLGYVIGGDDGQ